MFGGGGGMNPRKMKQMMKQMGIDVEEVDAEEVIIRTEEYDLVFEDAQVTKMDARGQETYQVVGTPEERERGAAGAVESADADEGDAAEAADSAIPEADIEIVVTRTGASKEEARKALEDNDGDLAAAVSQLE
ncbi:nascent polypeptide-associated complex protein [Haloarchaeobius amylolyticus]|uniref:nascent polypeptide-associated complex protein n=1 Tax=Haloarchaeobius amylolyticus TaxID=1198296 RepID=UPI00226DE702|nr:nascent polypeptide-associated complex protein [Haloarchaeobius amylolyticus]